LPTSACASLTPAGPFQRRISVIVQYIFKDKDEEEDAKPPAAEQKP